jgi:hypothetical protein
LIRTLSVSQLNWKSFSTKNVINFVWQSVLVYGRCSADILVDWLKFELSVYFITTADMYDDRRKTAHSNCHINDPSSNSNSNFTIWNLKRLRFGISAFSPWQLYTLNYHSVPCINKLLQLITEWVGCPVWVHVLFTFHRLNYLLICACFVWKGCGKESNRRLNLIWIS